MAEGIAIISLLASAATLVIGLIYSSKAEDQLSNVTDDKSLANVDVTSTMQTEGVVVPLLYGYNYVAGNTIWWQSFKYNTGSNPEYVHVLTWQVIGMGNLIPISEYKGFYGFHPQSTHEGFYHRMPQWLYFDEAEFPLSESSGLEDIWYGRPDPMHYFQTGDNNFILPNKAPGGYRILTSMPNSVFARTKLPGISHCLLYKHNLRQGSTTIPTYKYKVKKILNTGLSYENMYVTEHILNVDVDRYIGNNPAAIIYDLLTNNQYGLGLNTNKIDKANFEIASNYFYEKKYALNFAITQPTKVIDIIKKIQAWIDCYLIKNNLTDQYQILILEETDINNIKATVYDDDIIELNIRRKSWYETYNSFTANYVPVSRIDTKYIWGINKYTKYLRGEIKTMNVKNEANIAFTGTRREKTIDLTGLSHEPAIAYRLHQIMKKESFPFANGSLKTNLKFSYLQIGDVINIDSDEYNAIMPYRITDISYNEINKNVLSFSLLQMREIYSDDNFTIDDYIPDSRYTPKIYESNYLENLTFPAFSAISNPLSYKIKNINNVIVHWGTGQLITGKLTYGIDYTIDDHDKIHLDEIIYADEIIHNANGLMNVDVVEIREDAES